MCCEEHSECLSLWLTPNAFEVMQDGREFETETMKPTVSAPFL